MKPRLPFFLIPTAVFAFSVLFFGACKKNNTEITDQQQEESSMVSSEADAEADAIFNRVFDDVIGANDDVGLSGTGVFYGRTDTLTPVPHCFTVTIQHPNNTPFPVIITIDFGTTGCPGPDGRVRRGIIRTEYTARLLSPGAMATTSFDGYYIDSIKVEGQCKITNVVSPNTTPLARKFKVEVTDAKLTKPSGNYISWNSTKFINQVEGLTTPFQPWDDIFRIEGNSRGKVLRGNLLVGWESSITEPLIKKFICRWIVKGKTRTVRQNSAANTQWVAELDFGNGDCDDQAILTINGISHQITLR